MVTSSVTLKLMNKTAALDHPTGCAQVITMVVLKLFTKLSPVIEDIRGIGVQCGRLALISDVGYSVTSEAITRMFRTKAKKKEEPEQVQSSRPEENQLPLAHSTLPPTFFGESSKTKILQELVKYLRNEPEEDAVGVVTDFLYYLLRDGCLKTLVTTCLTLLGQLYSDENRSINQGWLFALNFIFDSLDERCRSLYGAPMIRPAIDRGQKHEDEKGQ
ncbi:hypothetical protein TELCIR_05523 [Teladorsagia circumcincta]|uniref:Uncharacterized protein n=1 Tax=Teladorsagia circumcincta TaxID=45464 RepID=A0A2G9UQJ2_TELCI|nr:hypothetical protein TELCIR_05523 [Teladorsagia circumcincta]